MCDGRDLTAQRSHGLARGRSPRERPDQIQHPEGVPECDVSSTYLNLNAHVIFATKARAPMIADAWIQDLHGYLGGTLRGLGAIPIAVGGVSDHVHLLFGIKATHSIADLVREVKKASAVWGQQHYQAFRWQSGYAAFSVGHADVPRVAAYVGRQQAHHSTVSSAEELRQLLAELEIEHDERYFE